LATFEPAFARRPRRVLRRSLSRIGEGANAARHEIMDAEALPNPGFFCVIRITFAASDAL